jgi:transposase
VTVPGRHTRLRDRGRTVTEVAALLECNPVTVRAAVHRFEEGGLDVLPEAPRPSRPARILGTQDRAGLTDLLDASAAAGITWTSPALRDWLRDEWGEETPASVATTP